MLGTLVHHRQSFSHTVKLSRICLSTKHRFVIPCLSQVVAWLDDNFMYGPAEDAVTSVYLHVSFMSLRTNTPFFLKFEPNEGGKVMREEAEDRRVVVVHDINCCLSVT